MRDLQLFLRMIAERSKRGKIAETMPIRDAFDFEIWLHALSDHAKNCASVEQFFSSGEGKLW